MVEKQAIARLNREFALFQRSNNPQFIARPSESSTLIWHYVLFNLPRESAYYGGQYHGKLVFPREYPLKPPSIYMITPSGRFEINKRLCLSMSDYHPETWNPSWRVETILLGLVSFMLDESDPMTAGGLNESRYQRQIDARLSFFRNRKNREFRELFPELIGADRYFIGIGYVHTVVNLSDGTARIPLSICNLGESEFDSINSVDDLERAVNSRGINVSTSNTSEKSVITSVLPWLAVALVAGAWIYSQLNPPD
jgi:ubiquitin-conjugating enzyme E2 J2